MAAEYEDSVDGQPLRQGDIFVWEDAAFQRPWNTYGVVITADCDIANNKISNRLSYIPSLLAEDYIWYFWREKHFKKTFDEILYTLSSRTNRFLLKTARTSIELTREAIRDWVLRVGALQFPIEVGMTDVGQIREISNIADKLILFDALLADTSPNVDLIRKCYAAKNSTTTDAADMKLVGEIKAAIGSLPGDVFHLPTIEGREDGGLFVMLRNITQCDISCIGTRPDDLRFGIATARRVGRIAAPYRFAIAQNFARVFSDIGLPNEYELRRGNRARMFLSSRPAA